jgi:hypothetical protein
MKITDTKREIIDEIGDFEPIPKWFTKMLKRPQGGRFVVHLGRQYGKNWIHEKWKEMNLNTLPKQK